MSIIEGVGDEVLLVVSFLVVLLLMFAAWISTSVAEQPLIRVIILDTESIRRFINVLTSRYTALTAPSVPSTNNAAVAATGATESSDSVPASNATTTTSTVTVTSPPPTFLSDAPSGSRGAVTITTSGANKEALSRLSDNELLQRLAGATSPLTDTETPAPQPASPSTTTETSSQPEADAAENTLSSGLSSSTSCPSSASPASQQDTLTEPDSKAPSPQDSTQTSQSTDTPTVPSEAREQEPDVSSPPVPSHVAEESIEEQRPGYIRIKIRYLDDRQRMVQAHPQDTIGEVKRRFFASELAENMAVRFIFRGQELRQENSSLRAYHIEDNSVVHCLLSQIAQPDSPPRAAHARTMLSDFDIGLLMFPLFGLMLVLIWYCRIMYKSYFNAVSTFALIGITFLFLMAMTAIARAGNPQQHEHDN